MLGTTLQFGGVGGDDRFYIPVKTRKNQNQRKQAQRDKNVEEESITVASVEESVSNIDRFLDSTKLLVPAQYFSKVFLLKVFDLLVFEMLKH